MKNGGRMTQLAVVKKAVAFIDKKTKHFQPEIALITGSGLAGSGAGAGLASTKWVSTGSAFL